MSKASMARAIAKAGKKQEAQTRGLTGSRNQQGDFMPESEVVKAVEPDLQNYIEDVKAQIDEVDAQIAELNQNPSYDPDLPFGDESLNKQMEALTTQKAKLVDDLIDKLNEEGVEIPKGLADLEEDSLRRNATWSEDDNQYMI